MLIYLLILDKSFHFIESLFSFFSCNMENILFVLFLKDLPNKVSVKINDVRYHMVKLHTV